MTKKNLNEASVKAVENATLNIHTDNEGNNIISYDLVPFNAKDEDSKIDLEEVLEAFEGEDMDVLYHLVIHNSEVSESLYNLYGGDDEFEWTLEAEDGSEISSGTREVGYDDVLDENDIDREDIKSTPVNLARWLKSNDGPDVPYTNNDYILIGFKPVTGAYASFKVPADIDMEEIKFIPYTLSGMKFKDNFLYDDAFDLSTNLSNFQYKGICYESDNYEDFDDISYGHTGYILIKYDEKEKQWDVIKFLGE